MNRITEPIKGRKTGKILGYRVNKNKKSKAFNKLGYFEDLQEQERLLILPCAIGDVVYVLAECEHIAPQLDGTLYDENGGLGTATGYYCPYEYDCPFPFDEEDFESCETYKHRTGVFKDYVNQISIFEDGGVHIFTENCAVLGIFGQDVFLTKEEAEKALSDRKNN